MKKITTIFGCLIATVAVMNGQSYSELTAGTTATQQSTSSSVIISQQRTAGVISFNDRGDFDDGYAGVLVNEDFSGGPGAGQIIPCGTVVSSAGDSCFAAGVLEDGFNITASTSGGDVIYIGANAIGNTSTLLGANTFADRTILGFSPDGVYAVGFDLFVSGQTNCEITVYDIGGNLLDGFIVSNTPDTENFFGVISDVAIGSIEMAGELDSGELFGNLSFGFDALGVQDNSLAGFNFYPNPTTGVLNLSATKNIESVTIFSLLGQKVLSTKIGATTSDINLSGLVSGTYVMEVTVEGKIGTYKITKK